LKENTSPLVSVIMPVYNGQDYIAEAIESILNQTFKDFELIIINDGSTDRTEEVIKSYLNDKRVRYYKQLHKGYSAAINQGFNLAEGRYICFQDADDVSLPIRLEEEVDVLENNPDVELVYSPAIFLDDDDNFYTIWGGMKKGLILPVESFYKLYVEGNFLPNTSVMFKRRHLNNDKLFREDLNLCADFEHHFRVTHDYNIYEITHPLVKIRRGKHHKHLTALREENFNAEKHILKKIYQRFKNKNPKVTRIHYFKAMSNQFLKESQYYIAKRDVKKAIVSLIKSLIYNPFKIKVYKIIIRKIFYKLASLIKIRHKQ